MMIFEFRPLAASITFESDLYGLFAPTENENSAQIVSNIIKMLNLLSGLDVWVVCTVPGSPMDS